jgi:hypothetical protein
MKIEEVKDQEMYCLFAPDGSWQALTLAPSFEECVAVIRLLHSHKLGQSFSRIN